MSAFPSSSSNKSWWSRSKPAKDVPALRTRPSLLNLSQDTKGPSSSHGSSKSKEHTTGSKFNSFVASAMGKKHKKPNLAIQDPPPSLITTFSAAPSVRSAVSPSTAASPNSAFYANQYANHYANRPPAKSVSTVRSYERDLDQASDYHTISEPRTPSDHPRDRRSYQNSLLTLSDPDPFAAGAVIVSRLDQDPNRLSVYSDSSLLDPHSVKRGDVVPVNRMSYGSSSSNSHGNADAQANVQAYQPVSRVSSRGGAADKRHNRETSVLVDTPLPDLSLSSRLAPIDPVSGSPASRTRVMSAASSNAALPRASPGSLQAAHPQLRQRGMTVAGDQFKLTPLAGPSSSTAAFPPHLHRQASDHFARSDSSATPSPVIFHSARSSVSTTSTATPVMSGTRPLVLIRKASSSRVNIPPLNAAPPSTRLPPPPPSPESPFSMTDLEESMESLVFPDVPSSSSSSLSFASMNVGSGDEILSFMRDSFAEPEEDHPAQTQSPPATVRECDFDARPTYFNTRHSSHSSDHASLSSRSLKKAISHQNLLGKHQSEVSVASASTTSSSYEDVLASPTQSSPNGKAPRKQRSFHHSRLPLPPLPPLRYVGSRTDPVPASPVVGPSTSPQLGPTTPQSARRRLFSGSSGRRTSLSKGSTSPPPPADDDVRSILSLDASQSQASHSRETTPQTSRQRPIMLSFANMGSQLALVTENACIAPQWDEIGAYNLGAARRTSQTDYTPQHIMSPADMLRLEEQLAVRAREDEEREEEERRRAEERKARLELDPAGEFGMTFAGVRPPATRPRNDSVLSSRSNASAATLAFGRAEKHGGEDVSLRGVLLQHTTGTTARRPSTASGFECQQPPKSMMMFSRSDKASSMAARPSTAQASLSLSPPASPRPASQSPSPQHPLASLPPPPRPRLTQDQKPRVSEDEDTSFSKRASVSPFQPLPPPPRPRVARPVAVDDEREQVQADGRLSAFSSRPPSAFNPQKLLNRRSVMKKPSFLDFEDGFDDDDDDDEDGGRREPVDMRMSPTDMEGSFLDLDRGKDSFDTIRSGDDNAYHIF